MRARAVVVAQVAVQATTEVSLIQDDHVVEEFAADGADHAFDEGILPRGAWCSENLGDEHALRPSSKLTAVNAVAIAQEIAAASHRGMPRRVAERSRRRSGNQ